MTERAAVIEAFLRKAGWGGAQRDPVPGDASTRSYQRLEKNGRRALLMNAPRGAEGAGEPEGATVAERRAIGYNALARLAGPNLEAFLAVAQELGRRDFSAPRILAADIKAGLALTEDFGDDDFFRVIAADPSREAPLYEAAVDVLAAIYRASFPDQVDVAGTAWRLRDYDEAALLAEMDLCLDYYAPDVGRPLDPEARDAFTRVWREGFAALGAHAHGLALRDFHAQNLFWLPERDGYHRVGLIDFQDALFAHPAYDLSSLLEDIRRDVSEALFEPLKRRFCHEVGLVHDEAFEAAYHVQAAQRATKLLGFPVRADRDFGKLQYRSLLPRVRRHLQRDLSHPACAGIRAWFEDYIPEALQ